jgi:hypothetical protein
MAGTPLKRPVVPDGCYDCSGEGWVFIGDIRDYEGNIKDNNLVVGDMSILWAKDMNEKDGMPTLCTSCDGWGRDDDKDWEDTLRSDGSRPHRFPPTDGEEILAWKCVECDEWINEFGNYTRTQCPIDWRYE